MPNRVSSGLTYKGWVGRLLNIDRTVLTNNRRKMSAKYACAEFLWYMHRNAPLEMIAHYAPQYTKFAEPNGQVWGAYGKRFVDLIPELLGDLRANIYSRRAVIPLYQPKDLIAASWAKDIPCTLSWQFINDNEKLCMIATMRSNDLWLGFPYDVFVNTCVQRYIADLLGWECGWYQHQVGDMHIYEHNIAGADEAIHANWDMLAPAKFTDLSSEFELSEALQLEEFNRVEKPASKIVSGRNSMIASILNCLLGNDCKWEELNHVNRRGN